MTVPERDLGTTVDRGLGVLVLAFGLVVFFASRGMRYTGASGPGPGFLPTWLSVALAVCGALLVLGSLRHHAAWSPEFPGRSGALRVAAALVAIVVSAVTLTWLGFIVVASALTFFLAKAIAGRSALSAAALAALLVGAFTFGFGVLLKVPLPKGPLGF